MMTDPDRTLELAQCRVTLIVNAKSGRRDSDARIDEIRARLEPLVGELKLRQPRRGAEIAQAARDAVEDGSDVVAVLGGDGSQSAVAGVLAGSGVAMAVLPGGTFNYFARELGIETLESALDALVAGRLRARDLGAINGRVFINNASFGFYPHILEHREAVYQNWGRSRIAAYWSILLALRDLNDPMGLTVTADGAPRRFHTTLAFVARSAFQLESLGLEGAEAVRAGRFALFIAKGKSRGALIAACVRLMLGNVVRGEDFELVIAEDMVISSSSSRRLVALDGEKEHMSAPFRITMLHDALQVFVPAPPPAGATDDGAA